jgi:hypothetical protein
MTDAGTKPALGSSPWNPAYSPQQLIREGIAKSGWYYIRRNANVYYLYCDLTTLGPSGERGHILFLAYRGNTSNYNFRTALGNDEYVITANQEIPFPVTMSKKYKIALPASDFLNMKYIAMTVDDATAASVQFSYPNFIVTSPANAFRYFKHIMDVDPSGVNSSVAENFRYWAQNTGYYTGGSQLWGLRIADKNAGTAKTVIVRSATSNGLGFYGTDTTFYMWQDVTNSANIFATWVLANSNSCPFAGSNSNGEWGAQSNYSTRGNSASWGWSTNAGIYAFAYFQDIVETPLIVRPISTWNQYAVIYDIVNGRVNYFVDGILFSSKIITPGSFKPTTITLASGKFRNLALYDRVITQDTIQALPRFSDLSSYSYNTLGTSSNPVTRPQDLITSGILTSNTYWIDASGQVRPYYVNLDTNGKKGYVLLAACDNSGNWNPFTSTNNLASYGANGVYSTSGIPGKYSIDYHVTNYGFSHFMFITGNGSFWFEVPVDVIRAATGSLNTYTIRSGVLPSGSNQISYITNGTSVKIYGTNGADTTRCMWADASSSTDIALKNANGGMFMYGFMGNVNTVTNALATVVSGSRASPVDYSRVPNGTNSILWVSNTTDTTTEPLMFFSDPLVFSNSPFALVASSPSSGNWGSYDSSTGDASNTFRGNATYGDYLQGTNYIKTFLKYPYNRLLFRTGDGVYWFVILWKSFVDIGSSNGTYTVPLAAKSSNLSSRTVAYIKYDGVPDSPHISLTADFSDLVFWGENSSSYGITFKNSHQGTRLYIGGTNIVGLTSGTPASSSSDLINNGHTINGSYWLNVNGTPRYWYNDLTLNNAAGYTQVARIQTWRSNGNSILQGTVSFPESNGEFVNAFSGLSFSTFLFKTGEKYIEVAKEGILNTYNTFDQGTTGLIPVVSSWDPLVTNAYVKIDSGAWTLCYDTRYDASKVFWASQGSNLFINDGSGVSLYIGRTPEASGRYWRLRLTGQSFHSLEELGLYSSRNLDDITAYTHPKAESTVSLVSGTIFNGKSLDVLQNAAYTFEDPIQFYGDTVLEYDFGVSKEVVQLMVAPLGNAIVTMSYSLDRVTWFEGATVNVTPSTAYENMVYQKIRLNKWTKTHSFGGFNSMKTVVPFNSSNIELTASLLYPTRLGIVQVTKDPSSTFITPSMVVYGSNNDKDYYYVTAVSDSVPRVVYYPLEQPEDMAPMAMKEYDSWNFALSPYSQYHHQPLSGSNISSTTNGLKDLGNAYSVQIGNDIRTVEFEYRLDTLAGTRQLVNITDIITIHLQGSSFYISNLMFGSNVPVRCYVPLDTSIVYRFVVTWTPSSTLNVYVNGAKAATFTNS